MSQTSYMSAGQHALTGLFHVLNVNEGNLDVEADIEGEQETIPTSDDGDSPSKTCTLDDSAIEAGTNHPDSKHNTTGSIPLQWRKNMAKAGRGVSDGTHREYIGLAEGCAAFLIKNKLISCKEDFLSSDPLPNSDEMIVAWIMDSCDAIGLDGKPRTDVRASYTHAQKMRASMTHVFGRVHGLGSQPWKQYISMDGHQHVEGNPSISAKVSTYMVGLHRRKVQSGETTTSACAVTPEILGKLHDFNHLPEHWDLSGDVHDLKSDNVHAWGGPKLRRALQAMYTIAFICMLRIDEVLKLQMEHIQFEDNKMTLTLPFRKTHQFGDIKPFVLHKLADSELHLCPVRAMAQWISASSITSGYVFRKFASGDQPVANNTPMSSEQFLEAFRNNLDDININFAAYGTHSFRRGGCQYFASVRRWKLRRICDWGGWSTEFTSLTIVKYLISWNDEPEESRDDFLNPHQTPTERCPHCGRTCKCS